jgi:hypothetical protein
LIGDETITEDAEAWSITLLKKAIRARMEPLLYLFHTNYAPV